MAYKKKDLKTPAGILRFFIDWGKNHKYLGMYFDISEYKGCEINLYFNFRTGFNISGYYTTKQDHAGLRLEVDLFGLELEVDIYDGRHWNHKANRWYLPGEEQRELDERKAKGEPNPNIQYGDVSLLDDED